MILKKIYLENIRSYEKHEVEFPEGSILLSGDVGSGKTSILLGVEFALFGLQPGQRGSSLLRNGTEDGKVVLEFEVDEKTIIIERNLKRGKTVSQTNCSIQINEEKREISVTELKNEVLEILNYPKEFSKKQNVLYKFTVYTPQEEMKQIIFQDPEARMNTLRHVFGIDRYKRILENASILSIKIREEKRAKEGVILTLEQDKLDLSSKEKELELKYIDLELFEKDIFEKVTQKNKIQGEKEEISRKIEEKRKFQQEIEKTNLMVLNKKNSISENDRAIQQLFFQIEEVEKLKFDESKMNELINSISLGKKKKEELQTQLLEITSKIHVLKTKNEESSSLQNKFSSLEICPTCLQTVEAVYRANVLNKVHSDISENTSKLKILEEEKNSLLGRIRLVDSDTFQQEKELDSLKFLKIRLQSVQEKRERLESLKKLIVALEKDIVLLNQHIKTLQESVSELVKFDVLFELKNKELQKAMDEEKGAEIRTAELKKEIFLSELRIKELEGKIKKTEELKLQFNYLSQLEEWISKQFVYLIAFTEKSVMVKLKSSFSKFFQEWFSMLVSDSFNVRLSEDFTPIIEQQDYEIDYAYLSGGERTAIALAYRLALNQIINSLLSKIKTRDLVILDEPTDGFSEQQLDKMRDVLQQLNVKQLIIVSHEQKIEGFVQNVLRFKKEMGVSKREQ
jgi:exonuclease SbcC